MDRLGQAVSGRTVAVVGNASSLLALDHGGAIDAHALVVRMNRGLPMAPASQGRRTSILAFSTFAKVADIIPAFDADHLVWMSPKRRDEAAALGALSAGVRFYDLSRWRRLSDRLGARPSVGAMVLDLMDQHAPGKVTIYGFDFKQSPTFYTPKDHIGPHDYRAEKLFCEALVSLRGWSLVQD